MPAPTQEPQALPPRPRIRRRYQVEILGTEGAVLFSELDHRWLKGSLYPKLLPLIDGRSTLKEIVHRLRDTASPAEIFTALVLLNHLDLLEGVEDETPAPVVGLDLLKPSANAFGAPASHARIGALCLIEPQSEMLRSVFRDLGLPIASSQDDLTIVVVDDYLSPELLDRKIEAREHPWLLVKPRGNRPLVGPLFHTSEPGCYRCLSSCLRRNRPFEHCLAALADRERLPIAPLPASVESVRIALRLAIERAQTFLSEGDSGLRSNLLAIDLASGKITQHPFQGPPDCQCQPNSRSRPPEGPIELNPRSYRETRDGGYRAVPLEETLARLQTATSPITGIVHSLNRRELKSDGCFHVYTAAHATPRMYRSPEKLHHRLQRRSAGKGISDSQARVSALAEAVERYAGFFRGDEPRRHAPLSDLRQDAIHPNECMLFSDRQYRRRERWNAEESDSNWVPHPFDESRPIDWTSLWSLTDERTRLLPSAYCFYDYADVNSSPFCRADSNGCAAGNTLEEAVLQGFLELVERDAVALWWYSRARRPAIRFRSFDQSYFEELDAYFTSLERDLWVLDLTSDLRLPVAVAVSRAVPRRPDDLLMGFGAHLDPEIAVGRALTEICQALPKQSEGISPRWLDLASNDPLTWLEPAPDTPGREAAGWANQTTGDLAQDVRTCVRRAKENDLEVLVLDQTRWDTPLRVVKVVVPGLRPWWARFAPGRLYEKPPDLGWVSEPLIEDHMNPGHLFL